VHTITMLYRVFLIGQNYAFSSHVLLGILIGLNLCTCILNMPCRVFWMVKTVHIFTMQADFSFQVFVAFWCFNCAIPLRFVDLSFDILSFKALEYSFTAFYDVNTFMWSPKRYKYFKFTILQKYSVRRCSIVD
jgi:hypothetical protein